jgi:hypothetical protein
VCTPKSSNASPKEIPKCGPIVAGRNCEAFEDYTANNRAMGKWQSRAIARWPTRLGGDIGGWSERSSRNNGRSTSSDRPLLDGWWGNVGVKFAGQKFSKWYPITVRQATDIGQSLENVTSESEWITVSTLNNRLLLFRPTAIDAICLLDEGADDPPDDWHIEKEDFEPIPHDIYAGLEDFFEDKERFDASSPEFRRIVEAYIKTNNLDSETYLDQFVKSRLYFTNSTVQSLPLVESCLAAFIDSINLGEAPLIFRTETYDENEVFYPTHHLTGIDAPRSRIEDEFRSQNAQSEEENNFVDAVRPRRKKRRSKKAG